MFYLSMLYSFTYETSHAFQMKLFGLLKLFTTQSWPLMTLRKKVFENIVAKGENAGNQHILLLPQSFLPFPKQISIFQPT